MEEVVNLEALLRHGTISRHDLDLFDFAETAEDARTALVRRGLKAHVPG
jgi:hypothetical protein